MKITKIFKFVLLVIIIVVAILIRIPSIITFNIPFTYDHGLTFLEIRDIAFLHKFRLIGPEGGIKGIFFGPTWYYLIAIPFYILKGDPRSGALVSLIINLCTIPFAYLIGSKISYKTGLNLALFFAFFAVMISSSANTFVVDTFPLINLLALWILLFTKKNIKLYFGTFLAGLSFHFEPVVALGFNLALLYILYPDLKPLKLKNKFILTIIWIIPFIPQILFDLRHNFLQTSAVLSAISKSGQDLGEILPLWKRFFDRPVLLVKQYHSIIGNGKIWLTLLSLVYMVFGIKSSYQSSNRYKMLLTKYCLAFYIIPILYFIFLFPPGIKEWYFTSFFSFYAVFISLGLAYDFKKRIFRYFSYLIIILFLFINTNPINTIKSLKNNTPSKDPSSLKNELAAIEWIYHDSDRSPFLIYTYSPAVYDYPYQYLIWWYAQKNKLSYPKDFSYRPKTYDYVPNKLAYVPPPETNDKFITYILIHSYDPHLQFWPLEEFLQPFLKIPLRKEKTLDGGIRIQKRSLL